MQYLSNRYARGKDAVSQYMAEHHCMFTHKSIVLAHGCVVEKQAKLGPSTRLAFNFPKKIKTNIFNQ